MGDLKVKTDAKTAADFEVDSTCLVDELAGF
jgi:hypothetical protein